LHATAPPIAPRASSFTSHPLARALAVVLLLFVFLVGVNGLGDGFKSLGQGLLDSFFRATENPFMGLMVGLLATTLVQSSSVTTSLIVGLVAAPENPLPIANAIPMVMGANIGTTVTNTIVSLAHMGRKEEFRRAFAVATCHDFFNYLAVLLLLPLELLTGYLRKTATWLAAHLTGLGGVEYDSPLKGLLKAAQKPIKGGLRALFDSEHLASIALILLSVVLIFLALMLLVRVLRRAMDARVEAIVSKGLHRSAFYAILVGMFVTALVQSSSITTSLLVPLAGAGLLTLPQAFPITIGANIGTTVTALMAALAVTGPNAQAGVAIALVHLLFNLSGTLLIYPTPAIRRIPLGAARRLADIATKSRMWALLYVAVLFYGLPALFTVLHELVQ
jgi:sodium-dependent phosphate cotransporter